jgi:hypothetical protein
MKISSRVSAEKSYESAIWHDICVIAENLIQVTIGYDSQVWADFWWEKLFWMRVPLEFIHIYAKVPEKGEANFWCHYWLINAPNIGWNKFFRTQTCHTSKNAEFNIDILKNINLTHWENAHIKRYFKVTCIFTEKKTQKSPKCTPYFEITVMCILLLSWYFWNLRKFLRLIIPKSIWFERNCFFLFEQDDICTPWPNAHDTARLNASLFWGFFALL